MRSLLAVLLFSTVAACGSNAPETFTIEKPFNRLKATESSMMGNTSGLYDTGMAYLKGRDAPVNYEQGTKALCTAARKGHVPAALAIADFYKKLADEYPLAPSSDGLSTPAFDVLAYAWYDYAARNGNMIAQYRLNQLAKHFSVEAHSTAKRYAKLTPNGACEYPPEGLCDMKATPYPRLCSFGSHS